MNTDAQARAAVSARAHACLLVLRWWCSHHFTINGQQFFVDLTEAGSEWGCAAKVSQGGLPNEHGTWLYGE